MALTLPAGWREAVSISNPQMVNLVIIEDGTNTWKFTDGQRPWLGYPQVLAGLSTVAGSLDPMTREAEIGAVNLQIASSPGQGSSSWIRDIIANNELKGKKCTIKWAEVSQAATEANYAFRFVGIIDDVLPASDGAYVELSVLDVWTVTQAKEVQGEWINRHPLELIKEIADEAGVASGLLDTSSLTASSYSSTISHYVTHRGGVVSYHQTQGIRQPQSALEVIGEIARVLDGSFIPTEEGKLRFVRFDSTAAVQRHFTKDDYTDFQQISAYENLTNRFKIAFNLNAQDELESEFQLDEVNSQAAFAFPGTSERIIEHAMESYWLEGSGETLTAIAASDTPNFDINIKGAQIAGFCGSRVPPDWLTTAQAADAKISASRPLYIGLYKPRGLFDGIEIVKAEAAVILNAALGTGIQDVPSYYWYTDRDGVRRKVPAGLKLTITERGLFGTSARDWEARATFVADFTIAVEWAVAKSQRWSYGAPEISIRVGLQNHDLQIGDLVSLDNDVFLGRGLSGTDSNVKFEIVGKEVLDGDSPGIVLRLVYATHSAPQSISNEARLVRLSNLSGLSQIATSINAGSFTLAQRLSGMQVTAATGREIDISAGVASAGMSIQEPISFEGLPLAATSDNYIVYDMQSGSYRVYEQTIGTAPPSLDPGEILLAKVTTDTTSITAVETYSQSDAVRLAASTATSSSLTPSSTLASTINRNPYMQDD